MKYESFSAVRSEAIDTRRTETDAADGWYSTYGKRAFDIVLALVLLPLLIPVIAILWLVARRDGGPGFFGHERIGQNGVPFRCWKVRSMVYDANARLEALLASDATARAEWKRDQKLTDDPRVTRFGNFIRRTSLDELPQIVNVLKGEMSFVGPRPVVEDELLRYGPRKAVYLNGRPGITGIWQVSGRNNVSYAERVAFDAEYSESISLVLDIGLICKTAGSVLFSTGK